MGKKLTKKLLVFLTLMCMIIGMNVSVSAETGSTGNTKAISAAENPADGTLQVWLEYEDDNGNSVALSGGSCFLINEEYVLSNYHIFNLNEEIAPGVTIRSAAMETLGLSELKDNDPHLKIRVYANRDMSVLATIHDSVQSQTMDYVAMKLSDKIYDRKPLALGDSSTVQQTQTVNAYGFPEDSIENKEFNTAADVSATDGTISKLTVGGRADFFEHTAQLNHGDSGGPLVDSNKSVIGVNTFTYGNSSDQKYYAVQINAIKSGLDTFGISYINAGAQATTQTPDEEEPEEKEGPDADLVTALKSEITKAKAVDTKNYTEESVKVLNDTISEAEKVANDTEATDAQVTSATSDVKAAVENLEEKSGMNFLLIGGIAAGVIVVVVVIIIIVVSSNSKKKKKAQAGNGNVPPSGMPQQPNGAVVPPNRAPEQPKAPYAQPYQAEPDGAGETKIILITSASGGVGKTSVAFGLCRCLERNYKKTLYVNADRLQSFQWMLENGEPIRDASVYAGLSGNLGNVYRIVRHVIRKEGFSYLPPFKAALMSLGIPYRVFALLAEAARKEQEYDYIVIDADSVFDEEKAALMQLADKILIVTKQTEYAVKATNELIQNVNRNNSDKYIFLCNDFKKEEENALLLPTAAHRFTVSEYIEHLPAYEMKGSGLPVQTPGLQKAAFLIM